MGRVEQGTAYRNAAMNWLVQPIEVAQAIGWLLSPASSGVTGINLPVNAGFLAGPTGMRTAECAKRRLLTRGNGP